VWVIDQLDYFLISFIIGSLVASSLKDYLSEEAARERLKKSIIKKCNKIKPILNSKEKINEETEKERIEKIARFALGTAMNRRGGQSLPPLELIQEYHVSNDAFTLAQGIKNMVERLAVFLKERELKGVAKIFFKNGRLILELLLYKCRIDLTYSILTEGLSTQVIVLTATAGGTAGFIISWFSVGASLVAPPLLASFLLIRGIGQQFLNQKEYLKFKEMIDEMLNDNDLKDTIRAFFMEGEGQTPSSGGLEMKAIDFNQDPASALKYDFNSKSDESLEEFVKNKMKEELGLIENPSDKQFDKIINRKIKRKSKGKTVFFRDLIDELPNEGVDLSDLDIIDAEILEEPLRIKLDDEF
jgi:hypothetical protein